MRQAGQRFLLTAALALGSLLGGCFVHQAAIPGVVRADLNDDDIEVVGALDATYTRVFFLHGLVGETDVDWLAARIREAASEAGANGVRHLRIEATFQGWPMVTAISTLSLVHPRAYRVQGELVRIRRR